MAAAAKEAPAPRHYPGLSVYMDLDEIVYSSTLGATTWWALVNAGDAPQPRQLSKNRTAWLRSEFEEWAKTRPVSSLPPPANAGKRRGRAANDEVVQLPSEGTHG